MIVFNNGTEITPHTVLNWCQDNDIYWHYIAPSARQTMRGIADRGKAKPEGLRGKLQRQAEG